MSKTSKFAKSLFDLSFVKYNQNYFNVFNKTPKICNFNKIQIRHLCETNNNLVKNKVLFEFSNGFFRFDLNANHYIVSYWTPLRSLVQVMDSSEASSRMTTVVDERNKRAYSASTPLGFVFCNLENLCFKLPALGLCQIQFEGNTEELINWKEKFESELQYGSDTGPMKEKSVEDSELSFLEHQKEAIKIVLNPLHKQYLQLVSLARTDAHRKFKWGGLFLLSAQLGFVARLTWFEYSWDIMEPITWMLTYAMMVGTFAYYIVTSQEYLVPSVERRLTINKFWKLAQKQEFDVSKFRKLKQQIKQLDEKILRLKTIN